VLAGRANGDRPPTHHHHAFALIGAGAAWLALGIVDMHVFALFELAHGRLLWDVAFHSSGSLAIATGLLLLHRPAERPAEDGSAHQMTSRGEPTCPRRQRPR
jgi:uncharacterized membrane protein